VRWGVFYFPGTKRKKKDSCSLGGGLLTGKGVHTLCMERYFSGKSVAFRVGDRGYNYTGVGAEKE